MKYVEKETLISEFIIDSTLNDDNIYSINMLNMVENAQNMIMFFCKYFKKQWRCLSYVIFLKGNMVYVTQYNIYHPNYFYI